MQASRAGCQDSLAYRLSPVCHGLIKLSLIPACPWNMLAKVQPAEPLRGLRLDMCLARCSLLQLLSIAKWGLESTRNVNEGRKTKFKKCVLFDLVNIVLFGWCCLRSYRTTYLCGNKIKSSFFNHRFCVWRGGCSSQNRWTYIKFVSRVTCFFSLSTSWPKKYVW